jgi:hypothetical protein
MTGTAPISSDAAHQQLVDHPYFKYRGCAPDPDNPRLAVGCVERGGRWVQLPVDAWHGPDRDGAEPQQVRKARVAAAVDVCMGCAVWAQCDVYANSVTPEGRLAEPDGIRAGRTALERHRALIKSRRVVVRKPAPVAQLKTQQRMVVLRAIAAHTDPYRVAEAAGVPFQTAQWQRSRLVTLLELEKSATRAELLEAAVARGLLEAEEVVADPESTVGPAAGQVPAPGRVAGPAGLREAAARVAVSVMEARASTRALLREARTAGTPTPAGSEQLLLWQPGSVGAAA